MFLLKLLEFFTSNDVSPKWKKWGLLISWTVAGSLLGWCWAKW